MKSRFLRKAIHICECLLFKFESAFHLLFSAATKRITWNVEEEEGDMFVGLYSLIKGLFFNFNVNNFIKELNFSEK